MTAITAAPTGALPGRLVALPSFDPTVPRIEITLPLGITIAEAVRLAFPGLAPEQWECVRVTIGRDVVPQAAWHLVRPRRWDVVLIRIRPGILGFLRGVLLVAVMVAAIAVGQLWLGPALAAATGLAGGVAAGLATAAVGLVGAALVNALIPVRPPEDESAKVFALDGMRNDLMPDQPVPFLWGDMRVAPPFAIRPYTQTEGNNRFLVCVFLICGGECDLSTPDPKIGTTPLSEIRGEDYEIYYYEGADDDPPLRIATQQVLEEQINIELSHEVEEGESGGGDPVPHIKTTARDGHRAQIEFYFAAGLFRQDGEDRKTATVQVLIETAPVGTDDWTTLTTLNMSARQLKPFWRTFDWEFSARGQYHVRVTRITQDRDGGEYSDRITWSCLRTYRPEYPLNYPTPVSLVELKLRASGRLAGMLDSFSVRAKKVALDWDAEEEEWVERITRSPASAYRHALQGPQQAFPEPDGRVDLAALADWHEYCADKSLNFDAYITSPMTRDDALADIAHRGRALPYHDGQKHTVIIDRPRTVFHDLLTTRNSSGLSEDDPPLNLPDALAVTFRDRTNDFAEAKRIVPFPGFEGTPLVVEELRLPGVTDPARVWIEARRRQHEMLLRHRSWETQQDAAHLCARRGDAVLVAAPIIDRRMGAGRVWSVVGQTVQIDETITVEAGEAYHMRVRKLDGTMASLSVSANPGPSTTWLVEGDTLPSVGDHVAIYCETVEIVEALIQQQERTQHHGASLRLIPHAPTLDALADAEVPPPWDGRVGEVLPGTIPAPGVPRIIGVVSGAAADGAGVIVYVRPAISLAGGPVYGVPASYTVYHRLDGAGSWDEVTVPAANGAAILEGYTAGQDIEIYAEATNVANVVGAASEVVEHTVGEDDLAMPAITAYTATLIGTDLWQHQWTIEAGAGIAIPDGVELRWATGTQTDWGDLTPLHTGLLTASPWLVGEPTGTGDFTFGCAPVVGGVVGPAEIIHVTV